MNMKNYAQPVEVNNVKVMDSFLGHWMETIRTKMIPYQWKVLNDQVEGTEPSHCMENFKIAAGLAKGEFKGMVFQDSDFAKWIEAVGYSLMWHKDAELEKIADEAIDIVVKAQQPDGYLNTYYILNGLDKRWTNLRDHHELYCAGHMIEGAIAYYQATGKDKLLQAMIRYVDHINDTFGLEEGKKNGYPGHEIIEMALVRLYHVTGDENHLKLAQYFIDERGKTPLYFEEEERKYSNRENYWKDSYFPYQYYQAGLPVREQETADGHSVRAVYLYSGMADVAKETQDEDLFKACKTLWNNMVKKRMYITGGIGSSRYGEAFTFDYDLPNDTVYAETCASIGLMFFARRMLEIEQKGEYADVMEQALYNTTISGMTLDGTRYFYVNPLEVMPEASEKDQLRRHVKVERQKWFACACCPPNLARLMASIGGYGYMVNEENLFMNLYIGGKVNTRVGDIDVELDVETDYPWKGKVKAVISAAQDKEFNFAVRIPGWCKKYTLTLNGKEINAKVKDGYAYIQNNWSGENVVELDLAMDVQVIAANPLVRENVGKVAVTRGPIVYCLEEEDNGNNLHLAYLSEDPQFESRYEEDFLGGVVVIQSKGKSIDTSNWETDTLYSADQSMKYVEKDLKWIPYYSWANRNPGEMIVWVKDR